MYEMRSRQPYRRKSASRGGALIFGMGLGALLATVVIVVVIALPSISTRFQYLPYYARTAYRKLVPHPEFLPTPAPTVSISGSTVEGDSAATLDLPPIDDIAAGDVIPAAISVDVDTTGPTEADIAAEENLLASDVPLQPVGTQAQLTGLAHQWQTWNNCGPATITTGMSFFGSSETQVDAAPLLKPNPDDKNVSPNELAAYARSTGMGAIVRQGGNLELIKRFLSNNFPVLVETWLVHDGDGLGHYRLITGFDDQTGEFITQDSLNGPDHRVGYPQFDADWRVFNRLYLIVYPAEQADMVTAIIGSDMNTTVMYERLVKQAKAEIEANPDDGIAYFNLGEARTRLGRYDEAALAFDQARRVGLHWRRLWYQFTPFEAYYATGRYQDVLDLAEATIKGTGGLEEAYYFQGLALHATGQSGAKDAFRAALEYNSRFTLAQQALDTLAAN